jgi:hypothetical protein
MQRRLKRRVIAGVRAVRAELSFRLKRADMEQLHRPGDGDYYNALEAVVSLCGALHDAGWDAGAAMMTA